MLEDYITTVETAAARHDRLTAQIAAMLPDWTLAPVVAALQTDARHGAGQCRDLDCRTGDPSPLPIPAN